MTPLPHTVGVDQSVAVAAKRMFELGVRHLPVVDGTELVGILSERDVAFVRSLRTDTLDEISVEEAMTGNPFTVTPETELAVAVRSMADGKYGSAIVTEGDRVVGLLTSTDALHVLSDLLERGHLYHGRDLLPSEIRRRIQNEHRVLRGMLSEVDDLAERVLEGVDEDVPLLRERTREVYRVLLVHVDLEDAILAPALRETDAYGPDRADALVAGHRAQRAMFRRALSHIDGDPAAGRALAHEVRNIVADVLVDMDGEEQTLLSDTLLTDDPIRISFLG